ncbi:MAG TPA: MOSC domain-containing protein [Thermoplasmata archaeon]|nr:MOSC domain-containing protein [Thermoplasmata archaeon]
MTGRRGSDDRGVVEALHAKPRTPGEHGLPKPSVPRVAVRGDGVEGDYNVYRQEEKHGDPRMAVLLIPAETLEEFRRDGWPVRPGDLGENVTTRGLSYEALAPPGRFEVGRAVLEISKACTPCDNLHLLPYVGPSRGAEFVRTAVGRRGWYARVVREGEIQVGDPIRRLG